ncbi:MAG: hypothetical protein PWQ57_897 [Desulfovibrionales bacterium]|nr:hypothetical protein [Desulfovibrionales bacterium]
MAKDSYGAVVSEHLRITVLRLLTEWPGYTLNESVLVDLSRDYGFSPSRDRMRTECAWLAEQGLVVVDGPAHCRIVQLTERGGDVAAGRTTVPGVKRPGPGDLPRE